MNLAKMVKAKNPRKIFESKEELEPFRGILKRLEGFMQPGDIEKAIDCLLSLNTPKNIN
ncbi:MAG: hypothetical protein AABX71_03325 [Nanoarchaeota archaeon]